MRKRVSILVIAVLALVILSCCAIWLYPDPNIAVLDLPDSASKDEPDTVCGSGSCTEYYDFTVDMSISDLTKFYKGLGYVCFERTRNGTNTPSSDIMPAPFWECRKLFPNGYTTIWFRQEQQPQIIRGLASRFWDPEL